MRESIINFINTKYGTVPEYPWQRYPSYAVFRHNDNNKWFAVIMDVQGDKVGLPEKGFVNVINLKVDDLMFRDMLISENGITPAYHMNKQNWITVLLDGSVPEDHVRELLEMSYLATASTKKKEKIRGPKDM